MKKKFIFSKIRVLNLFRVSKFDSPRYSFGEAGIRALSKGIGIDLRVFKGPGKGQSFGEPTEPGHPYCQPLNSLNSKTLTFEILIELINLPASPDGSASGGRGKTDYLLRKLVVSLENKHERVKLAVAGYRP